MTRALVSEKMSDMPRKPKPVNVDVGKRLELLRLAHGYETQRDMAELLGVTEDAWRSWERGINEFPVEQARRLRDRWGATLDYIYDGIETACPRPLLDKLRKAA